MRYFGVACKLKSALKKLGECLWFKACLEVGLSPDETKERHRLYNLYNNAVLVKFTISQN